MSVIEIRGVKIGCAEIASQNQKTALVFLHGVGSDKTVWKNQLDHFGKTRRVVAFDYPGYNESDQIVDFEFDRESIARLLISALEKLDIERIDLCGLSMGGVIALEIYKQKPEIVRSLVLANTFARHPKGDEIVARSLAFIANDSMRAFAEQRVASLLAPETPDDIRRETVDTMARINKQTYRWSSKAVWTADYLALLPQIQAPTLVIGGALDTATPPALSIELAQNIADARLEIIERAAHLSNLDQPEIFNKLIENFVENL